MEVFHLAFVSCGLTLVEAVEASTCTTDLHRLLVSWLFFAILNFFAYRQHCFGSYMMSLTLALQVRIESVWAYAGLGIIRVCRMGTRGHQPHNLYSRGLHNWNKVLSRLHCKYNKEPPNSIGNYLGPYSKSL